MGESFLSLSPDLHLFCSTFCSFSVTHLQNSSRVLILGLFCRNTLSLLSFRSAHRSAAISCKRREGQSRNICSTISIWSLQKGHRASSMIFLLRRFSLEGMAFWHTFQRKVLIFGGACKFQIWCQRFREGFLTSNNKVRC